jgi:hypothetical protein
VQTQKKGGKWKGKQHNRYVSGSSHGVVPCPFPLSSSPLLLSLHNVRDGPAQVPPRVCTRLKTVSATHRPFLLDVFLYFLHVHAHTSAHLTCEEEEKKKSAHRTHITHHHSTRDCTCTAYFSQGRPFIAFRHHCVLPRRSEEKKGRKTATEGRVERQRFVRTYSPFLFFCVNKPHTVCPPDFLFFFFFSICSCVLLSVVLRYTLCTTTLPVFIFFFLFLRRRHGDQHKQKRATY